MFRVLLPLMLFVITVRPVRARVVDVRSERALTTLTGSAFGTTFTVKLAMQADDAVIENLRQQIDAAIDRLNQEMSLWDERSELSRFNRHAGGEWFPVSEETVTVVEAAMAIRQQSDGAFDPTIRPLLKLWSFGPDHRPQAVPSDDDIAAARQLIAPAIETRREPAPALRKPQDDVELDLNAIAKGYAVDVLAELIAPLQPQGSMVEIGGEVRTSGTKADGSPWRIAIEQPVAGTRTIGSAIDLSSAALATSGDYRNYFEVDGKRYSHTLDPRTGRPITHSLASVSVIAADCMTADAWATALMVLGPVEGYNLAEQQDVAAMFLVHDGQTFAAHATAGFPEVISLTQPMSDLSPWSTFLFAAAIFGIAIGGMAIGVIVSNRRLRGSCGGLNGLKDEQGNSFCDACTTPPEQCDEFRKQIVADAAQRDDASSRASQASS